MISFTTMLWLVGLPLVGLLLWLKREEQEARRRQLEMELAAGLKAALALVPGGSRESPLAVSTPAVIEGRAGGLSCLICERPTELRDHAVVPGSGGSLRVVHLRCRVCHAPRQVWFRIEPPAPRTSTPRTVAA
jgi:hypothetical protein